MKKLILTLFLCAVCTISYSQYLLGLSEEEVKRQARELAEAPNLSFKKQWYRDEFYVLIWMDNQIDSKVTVSFNKFTNRSVLSCITPNNKEALNAMVQGFNEEHIRKSPSIWISHTGTKIIKIETIYEPKSSQYSFSFHEIGPEEDK